MMRLRSIQSDDLSLLCRIELDPANNVYTTNVENLTPEKLKKFIDSDHNLVKYGQLRLVIEYQQLPVGFLDIYDHEAQTGRAGIGIIVLDELRNKGIGRKALESFAAEWMPKLQLRMVYADVESSNKPAIAFFKKAGFHHAGLAQGIERFEFALN